MNVNTQSPEKLLPHMEKITLTCLKVLTDDACDDFEESFKMLVGKFIKNVVMNSGEAQVQQLQAFEGQMSETEKQQLAKYLAQ